MGKGKAAGILDKVPVTDILAALGYTVGPTAHMTATERKALATAFGLQPIKHKKYIDAMKFITVDNIAQYIKALPKL